LPGDGDAVSTNAVASQNRRSVGTSNFQPFARIVDDISGGRGHSLEVVQNQHIHPELGCCDGNMFQMKRGAEERQSSRNRSERGYGSLNPINADWESVADP
jgi:hypothetical protein